MESNSIHFAACRFAISFNSVLVMASRMIVMSIVLDEFLLLRTRESSVWCAGKIADCTRFCQSQFPLGVLSGVCFANH